MNAMLHSTSTESETSRTLTTPAVTDEMLHAHAPAIYAPAPHARVSTAYSFIPTQRVLTSLQRAGFVPVGVRQTRTRTASPLHARHVVRLRRRYETVELNDTIPEIVLLNSHDGTSAYHLYFGLFRLVCLNGMTVSAGTFASFRVPHRGEVVEEVIAAALRMCEQFGALGDLVYRMQQTRLEYVQRLALAERALALRYPQADPGLQPSQLLTVRREADDGADLWRTYNVLQENLLRGGLSRRSASGRLTRTRRISSIQEDVRLNTRLWKLATEVLAA